MDIDLRDLELIDAVHRHGTLTAAASHLFVSQPALSQRLLRLEKRLGAPLFDRSARGLDSTPAGKRMIDAAELVLGEVRDAVRDVRQQRPDARGPLRIATQCVTNLQWLPTVLAFLREHDAVADVTVETIADADHADALVRGDVDLAIVHKLDRKMDQVRLSALFDDELLAVHAADHPWRRRRYVGAEDFRSAHLVMCESYDQTRVPATPLPTPGHVMPERLTLLPLLTDLIIETVAGSDAITILPSWNAAPYLASGRVAATRIGRERQQRTWYAATRRNDTDQRIARLLDAMHATLGSGQHERLTASPAASS
jgi:LysR family transcriptional regulator, regulator for metE and metH